MAQYLMILKPHLLSRELTGYDFQDRSPASLLCGHAEALVSLGFRVCQLAVPGPSARICFCFFRQLPAEAKVNSQAQGIL